MTPRQFLTLLLLGLIWGASYLFIKVAVATIPPLTMVLFRNLVAGVCIYLAIRASGQSLPRLREAWRPFLVVGLFNSVIPHGLINWGELHIESGMAAILNALMPLFTVVFAHFTTSDERFSARKALGVGMGLAGVVVLMGPSLLKGLGSHLLGQAAVTGAAASYSLAAIYAKNLQGVPPMTLAFGQMAAGATIAAPLSILVDRPWTLSPSLPSVLSLLCLGVLGTALAYVLYFDVIRKVGATNTSLVTFLIPVTGVFWGWLILGERLGWPAMAALAMILGSIAAVGGVPVPELGWTPSFDPFGWASRLVPEATLHRLVRGAMAAAAAAFLVRRVLQYPHFLVKPLWAAETLVFVVLLAAFWVRTDPVDRSRGLAEIALPLLGAALPFALLLSPPAGIVFRNRVLHLGIFWFMTLSTVLTAWGMWALRRSFSITVEARGMVTEGPYRWVRHPIYLAEILTASSVAAWRLSLTNVLILAVFVSVQLFRARMEEVKLGRNFTQYADYARRTWWVWR